MTGVAVRRWAGGFLIYAADARLENAPILLLRADPPSPSSSWSEVAPVASACMQRAPAVLYGDPVPGAWCSVEVDSRLWIGRAPLAAAAGTPRFFPPA